MSKLDRIAAMFDGAIQVGENEWQARCPCCEAGSEPLTIKAISPQWIHVACGRCDDESVLAKKGLKPIDLMPGPGKIGSPEVDHVRGLLPHHLKELRASGLTDETIKAAGIFSETKPAKLRTILEYDSEPKKLCPAIMYPFDANGNYCRAKPDKPRTIKGKAVKYESPRGRANRLYIPPGARAAIDNPIGELIITEGEKKALAGTQVGIATIGLVGVFGWKAKKSERLIPDFDAINWKGRPVFIAFDSDIDVKDEVQDAEARLAKHLTDRGAIVRCVRIPDRGTA